MAKALLSWLVALMVPVLYAGGVYLLFNLKMLGQTSTVTVMFVSFLLGVPFGMGYLTVALSDMEQVQSKTYCSMAPWISVFIFMGLTFMWKIEGLGCWLMICPIWLLVSSIAGFLTGARRRRRADESQKLQGGWILLLPILCSPVESLVSQLPVHYEAYTYTDIQAPPEIIWSNVVRVRTIGEDEDHGRLTRILGFPRPIRAELNYAGVGGSRQAIFSKGLIFEEIVKEYEEQRKMRFSIKADAHSIPPSAMDEHIVIGGEYFDVLDGIYRLEKLGKGVYRLHLYSHFVLKTHFNWYASWWAGWIMKDIQNNILQVIQTRCQGKL
jgi:hypothetical protein